MPEAATLGDLAEDLALEDLWAAMARGDDRLHLLARSVTLAPLTDLSAIAYRQEVLGDCLRNALAVRELYALAEEAVSAERKVPRGGGGEVRLNRALRALELLCVRLRRLSGFAARHAGAFGSAGFTRLFAMVGERLDETYLGEVEALLARIDFEHGVVATARLGEGNKAVGFGLREQPGRGAQRRFKRSGLDYSIGGRHDDDWRELAAFRGRVLAVVAAAAGRGGRVRERRPRLLRRPAGRTRLLRWLPQPGRDAGRAQAGHLRSRAATARRTHLRTDERGRRRPARR